MDFYTQYNYQEAAREDLLKHRYSLWLRIRRPEGTWGRWYYKPTFERSTLRCFAPLLYAMEEDLNQGAAVYFGTDTIQYKVRRRIGR